MTPIPRARTPRSSNPRAIAGISVMTAAVLGTATGCPLRHVQSALHPAGPDAAAIAALWWLMAAAFTAVFFLVLALMLLAIVRGSRQDRPPLGAKGFILGGGVVLPLVTLIPLYFFSLETSAELRNPSSQLTVRVIGHQWWWEVRYPEHDLVTANEIYIPAGVAVRFELMSADVIHSFWVPSLNGKRDLIPGLTNEFWLRANAPGTYRGQCAEYCGTQHANMAFHVVALPEGEFAEWLRERQRANATEADKETDAEPDTAKERGRQVFLRAGCARCHAIRGTSAQGKLGPDLTHIGSRPSLGAGRLTNSFGNLAGWISDAPSLKPGVHMPRFYLPSEDLLDLTQYLESLE